MLCRGFGVLPRAILMNVPVGISARAATTASSLTDASEYLVRTCSIMSKAPLGTLFGYLSNPFLVPSVGQNGAMDVKDVVGANLRRLMDYAGAKNPDSLLAKQKTLAKKAGVTQSTVGRVLRKEVAVATDTLQSLAACFKLQAYQLLIPNLEPDNPVTVPITMAERELNRAFRETMQRLRERDKANGQEAPTDIDVDSDSTRPARRKTLAGTSRK